MAENYIYAPAHNIEGGFRCKVPLQGSSQLFLIDGSVQGTGRPLEIAFEAGKTYEKTLQVIGIRTEKHPEPISFESVYSFAPESRANLILCSHTFASMEFRTEERVKINLREGASADVVVMQNEHNMSSHRTFYEVSLEKGASLKMVVLSLHGGEILNTLTASLEGRDASCEIYGLYLADGTQKVSNSLSVQHKVPQCYSRELFKGILDDGAKADFTGRIYVAQDAQRTEAYQECHNLLISPKAMALTQPQLEIYADDVKCSHGATNGRLDENALFYMRSRGIPLKEASIMQQFAFAYSVLEKISSPELKERMSVLTEKRLRGEFSDCKNCCRHCC